MGVRFFGSSVDSARLLVGAIFAGMSQLALCRGWRVGVIVAACILPFSVNAFGLTLWGTVVATAWPFWRQRDARLLLTGFYGVNGALCGMWASWLLPVPMAALLLSSIGALAVSLLLDAIVYPLGDAPIRLPPLTVPFLVLAMAVMPTLPHLFVGYEKALHLISANPARPEVARGMEKHLNANSWSGAGWVAYQRDNDDDARAAFLQAIQHDRHHLFALEGLGWVAYRSGFYEEARGWFEQAAARDTLFADARNGLGWISLMKRERAESIRHFSAALVLDASLFSAREGLGWALLGDRRAAESEAQFLDLLHRSPTRAGAIEGLSAARRALVLTGRSSHADPLEWQAVRTFFGIKALVIPVLALTVLVATPWAGALGLTLAALGIFVGLLIAGPCSLLWIDLHLQTLALIGFFLGGVVRPTARRVLFALIAAVAAVALWAIAHRLDMWVPLLSFNLVGLASVSVRNLQAFNQDP